MSKYLFINLLFKDKHLQYTVYLMQPWLALNLSYEFSIICNIQMLPLISTHRVLCDDELS